MESKKFINMFFLPWFILNQSQLRHICWNRRT